MRKCANCEQPYDEAWDACPTCTPKATAKNAEIAARLAVLTFLAIVGVIIMLFAGCDAALT